jgi:hypothetical protein
MRSYHGAVNAEIASIHVYHGVVRNNIGWIFAGMECFPRQRVLVFAAFRCIHVVSACIFIYHGSVI